MTSPQTVTPIDHRTVSISFAALHTLNQVLGELADERTRNGCDCHVRVVMDTETGSCRLAHDRRCTALQAPEPVNGPLHCRCAMPGGGA